MCLSHCSALAFNEAGDQLASVGGMPDYLLTLWRWDAEAIVLRAKAFSQDVYTVRCVLELCCLRLMRLGAIWHSCGLCVGPAPDCS